MDENNLFSVSEKININDNPKLNFEDAELLAYMATTVTLTWATNGKRYWYYVFEDIKECDFITFLFNRNGLYPTLHYSHYLNNYRFNPVLRMRSGYISKNNDIKTFVSLINACRSMLLYKGNHINDHLFQAKKDFLKYTR